MFWLTNLEIIVERILMLLILFKIVFENVG